MADTRLQAAATAHVDGRVRASGSGHKRTMHRVVACRVSGKRRAAATLGSLAVGEPPSISSGAWLSSPRAARRVARTGIAFDRRSLRAIS
jgi:hypothetical protein